MAFNLRLSSDFLTYLVSAPVQNGSDPGTAPSIPSLNELSKELGVSVASLREQVEVAKALGLVEVRPRTGIRRLPYSFFPAVYQSLSYAIHLDRGYFEAFSELRNHIEEAFWDKAVCLLIPEDHQILQNLIIQAWEKLHGNPVQIPHAEHRALHLTIYSRLSNPFVQGMLEAYWEAYEEAGLSVYADYNYLQEVWSYHQKMVDAICSGDFQAGYKALVEHKDLLYQRPVNINPINDYSNRS
jgi:DNA-binding FadR family transcriptional regulator